MAECARCKAQTKLYENGVPICLDCSSHVQDTEPEIRTILKEELAKAMESALKASETFFAVMTDIPSGIPHPDGVQRIHNASHNLSLARGKMAAAHSRLNEYLTRGIVPKDLKRP
jgi:exonuclease VII small subunit